MKNSFYFFLVTSIRMALCTTSYAQCTSNSMSVRSYGPFTPGLSDSATVRTNFNTLNNAVKTLGQSGGGEICLPEGIFYIGPDPDSANAALTINYDNITISGAGADKTILRTNGTYKVISGNVKRGHGILINGTSSPAPPRKNVVLRNFQLDGQSGWTGNYNWPADASTGDGWDISHKGVIVGADNYCDSILIENLYVHHYKGEVLYSAGLGIGKLTITNVKSENTNASTFNMYGADMLVQNCTFGGACRFWMELCSRQNQINYPVNRAVFINNNFKDARSGQGIVMTQGDFKNYAYTFSNNTMDSCQGVFGFFSGVGGPVNIYNNTMTNCGVAAKVDYSPGSTDYRNGNIDFHNNTVDKGSALLLIGSYIENLYVHDNHFTGMDPANIGLSTAVVFYGEMHNVRIEKNTFQDCRTPEQAAGIAANGIRPFFEGNSYTNAEMRDGQGAFYIYNPQDKVTPHFEKAAIYPQISDYTAILETAQYPDGQIIEITGGSPARPVKFAAGQATYMVRMDKFLTGTEKIYFRYDLSQQNWVEYDSSSENNNPVTTADIPRAEEERITVSPNPFTDQTNIRFTANEENIQAYIYDATGNLVYTINEEGLKEGLKAGSNLKNGVYILKINYKGGIKIAKLVKAG